MTVESVRDLDKHVWHPFTQAQTAVEPLEIVAGAGVELTDRQGRVYLDLISSWWVTLHGHGRSEIADAISKQARVLEHVIFADVIHAPALQLAERLTALLPGPLSRVFYSDNGSTAVEVALKMARQYWFNQGVPKKSRYIAFEGGYHGDTLGAMSVGSSSGFYAPFEDMLLPVSFVPYPETWAGDLEAEEKERAALAALERLLARNGPETAAIIIEPLVQGAAGMRMSRPAFVDEVVRLAHHHDVLVIFDEVMTGFGRTGTMFACNQTAESPDIICLSKGITGGSLPLAATVSSEAIYGAFLGQSFDRAFAHGHSYTANPLGCAAGLASLDIFGADATLSRIGEIEERLHEGVTALQGHPKVEKGRVTGAIAAFDLVAGDTGYTSAVGPKLKRFFLDNGLLLRPLGNVVYLLPPYCVSDRELDQAFEIIGQAFDRIVL